MFRICDNCQMTMKRAYSILKLKALDGVATVGDEFVIEGVASTPTADRVGDIVMPLGAKFKLPMPLLLHHDHEKPVGVVEFAKPTKDGIPFRARFPIIEEAGKLKERVEEAIQSIKAGLIQAVSIGFSALEYQVLPTGGLQFDSWEWHELSLVTVPANAEATISTIKSLDKEALAASRKKTVSKSVSFKTISGVSEKPKPTLTNKGNSNMTLKEQLEALRAKRASATARMAEMIKSSSDNGETLSDEDQIEFDSLSNEVDQIDGQVKRVQSLEKAQGATATPVEGQDATKAAASRSGSLVLRRTEEKGIAFSRFARVYAKAKGNPESALRMAEREYSEDSRIINLCKAAVSAGSTSDPTWAGALVGEEAGAIADFAEFLRPKTIVGSFGLNGVSPLRRVPFRTALVGQTSGGQGYWVGEGKAKPLTKFDFNRTTLEPLKVANIAVLTQEALKHSNPSADILVRDSLVDALVEVIDLTFISPSAAPIAGVSPGSITFGVAPIASTGTDAAAVRRDLQALLRTYAAANNSPSTGVLIMNSITAIALSMTFNAVTGVPEFPTMTQSGGTLFGFPVIVSDYLPADSSGSIVVMVNASDIWLGDEGGVSVDMSTEASLQMDNAPTQSSVSPVVGSSMVSMFQTNSVAIRAEREISWAKRRASAVAYLSGVNWGA